MESLTNKSSPLAFTIRWVARILCFLAIVFIGMWSVEAVEGKVGLGRQILGFLMAPPFLLSVVLIIILIIAWKRELVGGILFALIGLATAPFLYSYNYHNTLNMASRGWTGSPGLQALKIVAIFDLPFVIVGVLFIISYFLRRPKKLTATRKVK
jgi:hypothetical protein